MMLTFSPLSCCRYILVHHGFGLVIKGSSNLYFFNILYWLLNTFLVLFAFLMMPLAKVVPDSDFACRQCGAKITEEFPANILMGQICMWKVIPSQSFEEIITRDRIMGYIFPTVYSVFSLFFFFKVKDCVRSQCLSRTTFRYWPGFPPNYPFHTFFLP